MNKDLGYRLPFALLAILGIFFAAQHYIPHEAVQLPARKMLQWRQPLGAFILFAAALGLVMHHLRKVRERRERWGFSLVTLLSMAAMMIAGFGFGTEDGSVFSDWFEYLITPIEATMFSLLAFFIASAAFRAFRARSVLASILLGSAFVVMLGLIPTVAALSPPLKALSDFLLEYPNTAAKRAILIGVALGAISLSVKTILGVDKTVLGKRG